jgi:hypothetical protein
LCGLSGWGVNMNKFLNPLNNMKAGRAKARAYADGGAVHQRALGAKLFGR